MTGIRATVKGRTDTDYYEIVGFGTADQGLLVITRIDKDNVAAETPLIDKFWQSLEIKL